MSYASYDLGSLSRGDTVIVTLNGGANVRLMTSFNYSSYQRGGRYECYGGVPRTSPYYMAVPSSGHWYVVVDMTGLRGSVRSNVRVEKAQRSMPTVPGGSYNTPTLSGAPASLTQQGTAPLDTGTASEVAASTAPVNLPNLRRPLASVPSLVQDNTPSGLDTTEGEAKEYDVFISHASEDKESFVRGLAHALDAAGLMVWYDEFTLNIGSSLRREIDKGLANSRFGIVVLSPDFFRKGWAQYELDGMVTRAINGEQVMLPIWHNLTAVDVRKYSPSLADKLGRSTNEFTVAEIAAEIASVIHAAQHKKKV